MSNTWDIYGNNLEQVDKKNQSKTRKSRYCCIYSLKITPVMLLKFIHPISKNEKFHYNGNINAYVSNVTFNFSKHNANYEITHAN